MSDLSTELNLALAVDNDDTADYLTTTAGLRGSLIVIDGLFNSGTGHTHNGAHQGGALNFINLSIAGDLTVNGASGDVRGHSLGGDLGYDGTANRAIAVNVGALREALTKIYHADHIVRELAD